MNPADMLRIVDSLHREKNIDKEIVFGAIESALISAAPGTSILWAERFSTGRTWAKQVWEATTPLSKIMAKQALTNITNPFRTQTHL